MNDQYNPDYPTLSGSASFLSHTFQNPNGGVNNSFYYPGANMSAFNQPTYYPDSRRNDGVPAAANFNTQPQALPQTPVMPFSSYPTTSPQPQTPGFNSLVESRRFDQPTSVGSNPWAQPQPQPQFTAPITPQPQTPSPWSYQTQQSPYDPNCAALYSNPNFGYDRSSSAWDGIYAAPRPIEPPVINWQQPQVNMYPSQQQPTYPAFNTLKTNMSWRDIAEKNWASNL